MKSTQTKIIIISLIFILIIGAIGAFGIYPEMPKYSDNKAKLSETKASIEEAQFKLSELNKLNNNSVEVEETREFVTGLLPDDRSTSDFVVKVEAMTDETEVIVQTISTGSAPKSSSASNASASNKDTDNSVDFTLSTTASYNTILTVLKKLESFPRFNVIDALYISGRNSETQALNIQAMGRIFYGK